MFGRKTVDLNNVVLRTIRAVNPSNNTNPTANYVLTADGQGNATWQAQQGGGTGSGPTGPAGLSATPAFLFNSVGTTSINPGECTINSTGTNIYLYPSSTDQHAFVEYLMNIGSTLYNPVFLSANFIVPGNPFSGLLANGTIVSINPISLGNPIIEITAVDGWYTQNTPNNGDSIIFTSAVMGLPGSTGASTGGSSVALTDNFMVGGSLTNPLMYSYDGITWLPSITGDTTFVNGSCRSVAWNGATWVAGGDSAAGIAATLASSPDGITWTSASPSPFSYGTCYTVAWTGSIWIAGGYQYNPPDPTGVIAYSSDGITWTASTSGQSLLTSQCYAIATNGSMILAGGTNWLSGADPPPAPATFITLIYSTDGITWTDTGNRSFANGYCHAIAWNGIRWIAGGSSTVSNNRLIYSTDGINWTVSTTGITVFPTRCMTVAWNGTIWVAGGSGAGVAKALAYSVDGITWDSPAEGNAIFGTGGTCASVTWNGSLWCATGYSASNQAVYAYSANGFDWTAVSSSIRPKYVTASRRVLPYIGYSLGGGAGSAGATGSTGPTGASGTIGVTGAIGQSFLTYSNPGGLTINSPTSITIVPYITGTVSSVEMFTGPCYFQFTIPVFSEDDYASTTIGIRSLYGTFNVQLGFQNTGTPLFTINGTGSYTYNNNDLIGIKYDGMAHYVYQNGVQVRSTAAITTEPIGFTLEYMMSIIAPATYTFNNIKGYPIGSIGATGPTGPSSINKFMVAGGEGAQGSNLLSYSPDGINWFPSVNGTDFFGSSEADYKCSTIAFNGSLWVAGGGSLGNTLGYSYDGSTWTVSPDTTLFYSDCFTVAANSTMWVAGGSGINQLIYSSDGINWTASSSGNSIITIECREVAWNGSMWIAVGNNGANGSVARSSDGINWSSVPSADALFTGGYCLSVAWNGSIWLIGSGGSTANRMAYSYDGINWTPVSSMSSIFTSGCWCIGWNGSIWVAGGVGTNRLAYSYDGLNWYASSSGNSILTAACNGVAWNGTVWAATGGSTGAVADANKVAYSYDGITWYTSSSSKTIFGTRGHGIAYKELLLSSPPNPTLSQAPSPTGGALVINSPTGSNGLYYSRFLNVTESTGPTGTMNILGNLRITGSISKGSGSFLIPHPNPVLQDTHMLRHCFVEAPTRGDNLYRWTLTTTNRVCEQALPTYSPFLNEAWQFFVQAVDGFGQGYCVLAADEGSFRLVVSEDGTYNVLGIATRKDALARAHFDRDGVEFTA